MEGGAVRKTRSKIAIGSLFFLHGLCFSSWAARIPAVQQELGLSEEALGTVLFAVPAGLLLSMPLATLWVSRLGSARVATGAIFLYAIFLCSLAWAPSAPLLALLLGGFGIASNLVNVAVNTQAIAIERIYGRSVMASLHGVWSLAGFSGALLGLLMVSNGIPPAQHFLAVALFSLLVLLGNFRFFLLDPPRPSGPPWALPDRQLLSLGLIAFCSMLCEGAMFDWSGIYFQNVVQAERGWVLAGYVAFMSTMAGARFFADLLVEKIGLRSILRFSGLLTAVGLLLSVAMPQLVPAILGFLLVGAGVSAVVPLVFSAAGKSSTRSPSLAVASVSTVGFFGFLLGPPLIGWIAGATNLRISFSLVAGVGALIFVLAGKIPSTVAEGSPRSPGSR